VSVPAASASATANPAAPGVERVDILGVGVDALTIPLAVETMAGWIDRREPHYVCVTGVHGVMESRRDGELQLIHHRAGLVTPDGVPLVWISRRRVAGGQQVERVYGPDLMHEVFDRSQTTGWRHFLYGGSPETLARLEGRLADRFPQAEVVGSVSPPFRPLNPAEDEALAVQITAARPDVLWVGLGTPKQERWMADHLDRLQVPVIVGVGAAFDFHAGVKRQAPAALQRAGLEWLFRLATEPRRLAGRYLRNNPRFLWLAGCDALRRHRTTPSSRPFGAP
jgi:N-acetylglucosaminyldiphosphoundecaprenol N-acetyl-beta-D-mannosaminyltransferase